VNVATSDPVVVAWRELAARHAAASAALDHELGKRHGLSLSEFEVLDRLTERDDISARAQDLADSVHLSQSAMSRLVDRLASRGFVERCACDMDRRGVYVVLTADGARRHQEAARTHRDVLSQILTGKA
jgi:DNA-binding MarR family transcriptional regulator